MNRLYGKGFFLYRPLYFIYKRLSDRNKIHFIRKNVRKGKTVLDIGANIGFYSLLLSRLVGPTGKVLAFEPEQRNFTRLKQVTKKRKNVFIHQTACGAAPGTLNLFLSDEMNIDHQTYDSGEGRNVQPVSCVALDDLLAEEEPIGFIKIDIQGYDYFAVLGLEKTIRRSAELTIIGEFWPWALNKSGVEPTEYIRLLEEWGLTCSFFHPERNPLELSKKEDRFYYTDFYSVKKAAPEST